MGQVIFSRCSPDARTRRTTATRIAQISVLSLALELPIEESRFISKSNNLNAQIVLGTVRNRDEAVQWLGYT